MADKLQFIEVQEGSCWVEESGKAYIRYNEKLKTYDLKTVFGKSECRLDYSKNLDTLIARSSVSLRAL